jgi:hypothetical protein
MKPRPTHTTAIAFPPRSSAILSGRITCSVSACGMPGYFWLNVALSAPMRRYVGGARSSAKPFAYRLRRRRPRPGDKWHMDEVFVRIQSVQHYPWRAVDQDGVVLDILVQPRRGAKAAKRLFRRLLKGLQHGPRAIVTDKLRGYGVAHRERLPRLEHRQSRYLTGRELTSAGTASRAPDATIQNRHGISARDCRPSDRS